MTSHPSDHTHILLLGAGELGTAFLPHISELPNTHIIIGVRDPSKYSHLTETAPNISLIPLDLNNSDEILVNVFAQYDIILGCTGFGQPSGTQLRLAEIVLRAGKLRNQHQLESKTNKGKEKLWYFPWQYGVDYDITKDGDGLMPLFGEQLQVRNLLRERTSGSEGKEDESGVQWTIVSTGIFMSFLFEEFWGIVEPSKNGEEIVVRALGNWDHQVTVTDVNDIGKMIGRILAGDVKDPQNRILYIAGDTVSYSRLADVVSRVTGKEVKKEEWSVPYLKEELVKDPDNLIKKYRVLFAGEGVWWSKVVTENWKLDVPLEDVESGAKRYLKI